MFRFVHCYGCAIVALLLGLPGTTLAGILIDFEGPDYVAGEPPPNPPWIVEWDTAGHTVEAGVGFEASQGLVVPDSASRGVAYELPVPLTADMGAQTISVKFKPGHVPSSWNFADYGGLQIGYGSKSGGWGELRGLLFRRNNGNDGIFGPGSMWGTHIAGFTPGQWYQITFDIHESWDTMTIGAGPVGETAASQDFDWSGREITRIWTPRASTDPAPTYDNLRITPGPPPEHLVGDMNGDGVVDTADVAAFVLALTDPGAYMDQFGVDEAAMLARGDINRDGAFDTADVAPFVQLLVGANTSIPEPASATLLLLGASLAMFRRHRQRSLPG